MEKLRGSSKQISVHTYPELVGIFGNDQYECPEVTREQMRNFYIYPPGVNNFTRKRSKKNASVHEQLSRSIHNPEFIKAVLEAYDPRLNGMKPSLTSNQNLSQSPKKIPLIRHFRSTPRSRDTLSRASSLYQISLLLGKGVSFEDLFAFQQKSFYHSVPRLALESVTSDEETKEKQLSSVRSIAMTKDFLYRRTRNIPLTRFLGQHLLARRDWEDTASQQDFLDYTPVPRNTPRNMKRETDSLSEMQIQDSFDVPEKINLPSDIPLSPSSSNEATKPADKTTDNLRSERKGSKTEVDNGIPQRFSEDTSHQSLQNIEECITAECLESTSSYGASMPGTLTSQVVAQERICQLQNIQNITKSIRTQQLTSFPIDSVLSTAVSSKDSIKVFPGSSSDHDFSIVGSEENIVLQPSTENAFPPNERPPSAKATSLSSTPSDEEAGALFRSRTLSTLLARTADTRRVNKGKGSLPIMPRKPKRK